MSVVLPEWYEKVKNEYVTSHTSYTKLANKYKISRGTLAAVAKEHNWKQKHDEWWEEQERKLLQKTAEKNLEHQAELLATLNESAIRFAQIVNDYLQSPKPPKPVDLQRLIQVWQVLHDSVSNNMEADEDRVGGIVMMVARTEEDNE